MNITEILRRSGKARIFFEGIAVTFSELYEAIVARKEISTSVVKWSGHWTPETLQELFTAFSLNAPILVSSSNEIDALPPINAGEIAFRSSGTEGNIKWAIHPYKHFLEGDYLSFKGPAFAFLSPSHAAGFDFLFNCLRGGIDFGFTDLKTLKVPEVRTLFGPPQAMAALLFFYKSHESLFDQLEEYYVSSDPVPKVLVEKSKKLDLAFKFKIFYGSTETMVIKVQEHPDFPHLFRFVHGEANVKNGQVFYKGPTLATKFWTEENGFTSPLVPYPLGDMVQEEEGWLSLQQNSRNLIKIWGHSLNIKMLEDNILALEGLIDTRVELINTEILGSQLRIHIWSEVNFDEKRILSLPLLENIKSLCSIEHHSADEINIHKKKRNLHGKKN